jgi:hypothetical protein
MANWQPLILTKKGQDLFAKAISADSKIQITAIYAGEGNRFTVDSTRMERRSKAAVISSVNYSDNAAIIDYSFNNEGLTSRISVAQIGFFIGDDLFAYMEDTAPDVIPPASSGAATLKLSSIFKLNNATTITLSPTINRASDDNKIITLINQKLSQHESDPNAHSAIKATSKTESNGNKVPTLSVTKDIIDDKISANNTTLTNSLRNTIDEKIRAIPGGPDLTNLNSNIVGSLINQLSNGANIGTPAGKLVKDSDVKSYIDGKNFISQANLTNQINDLKRELGSNNNTNSIVNKLNRDVDNLTTVGEEAIISLARRSLINTVMNKDNQTHIWNISMNTVEEEKGIEIGTNVRARGRTASAYGIDAVSIGHNAIAVGGNETRQSLTNKLSENRSKLDEIARLKENIITYNKEVNDLKRNNAKMIEIGERAKALHASKEKARLAWQAKLFEYNQAVSDNEAYLREYNRKLEDFNNRLRATERISGVDLNSDTSLTNAATQFKRMVEENTTMNLDIDFYKKYIRNYYKALGDLRKARTVYNKSDRESFYKNNYYDKAEDKETIVGTFKNLGSLTDINTLFYFVDDIEIDLNFSASSLYIRLQNSSKYQVNFLNNNYERINPEIFLANDELLNKISKDIPKYKALLRIILDASNSSFLSKEAKNLIYTISDIKLDILLKKYEISNFQFKYEKNHETSFLDSKKSAIDQLKNLENKFKEAIKNDPYYLRKDLIEKYKKENIDDVENANRITTERLTDELARALNINKNEATQKEQLISRLKTEEANLKEAYEKINPNIEASSSDISQYENILRQISNKATQLQDAQTRLSSLERGLTLNTFNNVDSKSVALGVNAFASGTNSVAIGHSSEATVNNEFSVGNSSLKRKLTNLANGAVSATSTDAVTGKQLFKVWQALKGTNTPWEE